MSKATITVEGFIANELTMREVPGHRVLDVSVPHTPSKKNDHGEWEDSGPTTWFTATFWDEHADAVLQSVEKGSSVILTGIPEVEAYLKRDNTAGAKVKVIFPVIAAVVRRPKRGAAPAEEPWAASAPAGDVWNQPVVDDSEVPF